MDSNKKLTIFENLGRIEFMARSPKQPSPDRSLSAFVEGVAHLLRSEVTSLKEREMKLLKKGAAHKIEQIALLLRKKVHETRSKKTQRTPSVKASKPRNRASPLRKRKSKA
jgi:hypothetical protein